METHTVYVTLKKLKVHVHYLNEAHIPYTFLTDLHSIYTRIKMFFSTNLRYPVENIMENALVHQKSVLRSGASLTYSKKKKPASSD